MENDVGKLTEKEMQKKCYFIDNGLLHLFLLNSETLLITYDEISAEDGISVVPVWKWLMGV